MPLKIAVSSLLSPPEGVASNLCTVTITDTQTRRDLLRALFLFTLASTGCGSSGGSSAPTGVVFTLDWPQTRALPLAAQSVRVRVTQEGKVVAEELYFPGPVTDAQLLRLPDFVPLVVEASAYGTADGTGDPLAFTSLPLRLARGRVERITLTLRSAITQVRLQSDLTSSPWALSATGLSSSGAHVLTAPGQWQWTLSDTALGTLTTTGASATFAPTGFGEVLLAVTELESGKRAELRYGVTVGEPTRQAPTVVQRSFPSPPVGVLALSGGNIVSLRSGALTALRPDGSVLWENYPDSDLLQLQGTYGSFLLLTSPQGKLALYRSDTGSRFWQASLASPLSAPPLSDGATALFLSQATPQLEARQLTSGTLLWSTTVTGAPLYADSTRLVAYDGASGILFALSTAFGEPLWQLLLATPPHYLGARPGTVPLLLLASESEVQGIFASNGARVWSSALAAIRGRLTTDKSTALIQTPDGLVALDAATGAARWTRSGIQHWVGSLANDDLLVLPTGPSGAGATVTALRATDGTPRWSAYLPSGENTVRLAGSRVAVHSATRQTLYTLDTATGAYLWHYPLVQATALSTGSEGTLALLEDNQLTLLR